MNSVIESEELVKISSEDIDSLISDLNKESKLKNQLTNYHKKKMQLTSQIRNLDEKIAQTYKSLRAIRSNNHTNIED